MELVLRVACAYATAHGNLGTLESMHAMLDEVFPCTRRFALGSAPALGLDQGRSLTTIHKRRHT
jgi:hypothetical protein